VAGPLDKLFDPDRLQQRWARAAADAAVVPEATEKKPATARAVELVEQLRRTVRADLGGRAAPVEPAIDEVARLVERAFPASGEVPADEELAKLRPQLRKALDTVEDVLEGLEIAGR